MGCSLKLGMDFIQKPEYPRYNKKANAVDGTNTPWLFASCAKGLKRCKVPLLSEADEPAEYTVRLYFADFENEQAGKRIFDIKLQGKLVLNNFDIVRQAGGSCKAIVRQFRGIVVKDNLVIELMAQDNDLSSKDILPVLCGFEALRERNMGNIAAAVSAR
jgi:hypothetical protein